MIPLPCDRRSVDMRCDHPAIGRVVSAGLCTICRWRVADGVPIPLPTPPPQPVRLAPAPCVHRGAVVREERCKLCGDRERIEPVLACAVHGACTQHRYRFGQPEPICLTCDDATPPS